jgi:hypothetical protein
LLVGDVFDVGRVWRWKIFVEERYVICVVLMCWRTKDAKIFADCGWMFRKKGWRKAREETRRYT